MILSPPQGDTMWDIVKIKFDKYPAQEKIAEKMMEAGISVRDGTLHSGDIRMPASSLALSIGVDRRVVLSTIETIMADDQLVEVFSNIAPICSFKAVAPHMKWGVLEILPEDVDQPGIMADVTRILASEGVSLRQVLADDPGIQKEPKAFFISEKPIPSKLLPKIKELDGVRGVAIY